MYSLTVHSLALVLTIAQHLSPLCARYSGGVTLCRGCRVRYIKYPYWPPNSIMYMDRFHKPLEVIEKVGGGDVAQRSPSDVNVVRIVNQYKRINEDQLKAKPRTAARKESRQPEDYNFIVKVQFEGVSECSGALVAPHLILTSSICCKAAQLQQLQVLTSRGRPVGVAAVQQLPTFNELTLLTLKSPESTLQPIALCDRPLTQALNATMLMASDDLSFYGRRRTQLIGNQACKSTYLQDEEVYITPHMICARNSAKPDKCATVRGDALLVDDKLCGLNVYGAKCQVNTLNADLYANLYKANALLSATIQKLDQ